MEPLFIGMAGIAIASLLIVGGLYIAVALGLVAFIGTWFIRGDLGIASNILGQSAFDSVASYELAVIPLFVLMGNLISIADIGRDTFRAANQVFRRMTGGLGIATVAANVLFAAVTGVSIASCVIFTKVAVPEMLRFGYHPRFATGVVAGSSVLGMLLPPSVLMIVFAMVTGVSVGQLFIAGIVPGLILAAFFGVTVYVMARFMPNKVGNLVPQSDEDVMDWGELLRAVLPIFVLVGVIVGGIYSGFFTATEAAAVGAAGAFLFALLRGKLTLGKLWRASVDTGQVAATICLIVVAASLFSRMLALSGVSGALGTWLGSAEHFYVAMLLYILLLLLLGAFLDSISTILLSVPIALPIFMGYGVDLVWLGIVTVLAVEAGLITPPLGIAVFAVKGALEGAKTTVEDIFRGSLPFLLGIFALLALLVAFPSIVTFLN